MLNLSKRRVLFVLFFCVSVVSFSQVVKLGEGDVAYKNITPFIEVFKDESGVLTANEVQSKAFTKHQERNYILPFSDSAFWLKINFEALKGAEKEWVLHVKNELTEDVSFYEYNTSTAQYDSSGHWDIISSKNGDFSGQEAFFRFQLEGEKTVLLRIKSQRALVGVLAIYPAQSRTKMLLNDYGQRSLVNGLLIFRLLLVLTLGLFVIKDLGFRAYSFLVIIKTFGYWGLINVLGPALSSNAIMAEKLNFFFYGITPIGTIIFCFAVLPFYGLPSWSKKVLYAIIALTVVVHIMVQLNYNWLYLFLGTGIIVFSGVYIMVLFGIAVYKKLPVQKYYSIPFIFGVVSYVLMNVRILFQIQIPFVSSIAFFFFVGEILVFIFFLGKIFRETEVKHILAAEKLKNEEIQSIKLLELDNLKTSFFTNISHELKTPLTLISGPVEELRKKYPEEKLLGMIRPNLNRLKQLINQILDIQKLEAGKQEVNIIKKDLAKHLRMHVFSFQSLAESKRIELSFTQNRDQFVSFFDEDKLNKIIDNLLSNAIKYTSKGGRVTVKVVLHEEPQRLQISVEDTGYGIAQKDLPFIFDRFYQVNNDNYQGSGVGLALVKELVAVLKGTIDVSSELHKGSNFLVSLPVDEKTWKGLEIEEDDLVNIEEEVVVEVSAEEPSLINKSEIKTTKRDLVLLVEDNEDMQDYLKTILQDDYDIIQAFNGKEGIEMANLEVPDIIVCDLMMPVMNGFEFSKEIKGNMASSHVPIIMLTAKSSKESRMESFDIGIDQYMTKPFDADELKGVLKNRLKTRKNLRKYFSKENNLLLDTESDVSPLEKYFIDSLNNFLELNYPKSTLSVSDIALSMEMSDTQLRRKLKNISEYSPNEYLRKFRLQKAQELLKNGNRTVSEIAFEVGFENLSYFSKTFQQEYGCLPSEYISV